MTFDTRVSLPTYALASSFGNLIFLSDESRGFPEIDFSLQI
jgi:hypothetical protein